MEALPRGSAAAGPIAGRKYFLTRRHRTPLKRRRRRAAAAAAASSFISAFFHRSRRRPPSPAVSEVVLGRSEKLTLGVVHGRSASVARAVNNRQRNVAARSAAAWQSSLSSRSVASSALIPGHTALPCTVWPAHRCIYVHLSSAWMPHALLNDSTLSL